MKLNFYIILLLLFSFIAKADQIFELIKIPNLTLHKLENKNSLAYLKPTKDFFVGSSYKNVSCKKNQSQNFNKKYLETQRGFDRYNDDFFRKIKLKYIVLCSELEIAGIPALGFANPEMKTLILNINSNNSNFERVLHHEVFHIIEHNFNKYFSNISWGDLNSKEFNYSACSTCSNNYSLDKIYDSKGFVSEYAKSTISEDMAETFSLMMSDNNLILNMISKDEILDKKVRTIKNIVKKLDFKHQF
ncbi:MAG: putative zinc-binding metallopeptidase [Candidatus Pelagibacter sp.]